MSIKDNSVFPFLLLAALVYIIFYICLNSFFLNGKQNITHEKAAIFSEAQFNPIKPTIEDVAKNNYVLPDSLLIDQNYQYSGWSEIRKDLSQKEVENLLGKPSTVFKGITELWYYDNLKKERGMVLFYKDKVVNWNLPGLGKRF